MQNPMSLLLIEDDEKLCKAFEEAISNRKDVSLISKTNSSLEALKLVKTHKFEGIIVDLELHYGSGSGFDFLKQLKNMKISSNPIVVVNTNIISDVVYEKIHKGLADMIFYKKQKDYSPKLVIDSLVLLRRNDSVDSVTIDESLQDKEKVLSDFINTELNLVGINYKLKGRQYIYEAILYILNNEEESQKFSAIQFLANKNKLLTSSISRAIQTAINEAWRTSAIEDLKKYYTAKINYHTGVPTPTEFIYYYVEKARDVMKKH